MGDFNVIDVSDVYEIIIINEFVMKDVYKMVVCVIGVDYIFYDFVCILVEDCEKIDFIFVIL